MFYVVSSTFMNPEPLCPIRRGLEEGTEKPVSIIWCDWSMG